MAIEKDNWLDLTKENILDPELPICDAHHHLWDTPGDSYMIDKFSADLSGGHNILKTVYVDCEMMYSQEGPEELRPVGETEYVKELAENYTRTHPGGTEIAAGMVAYADLKLGDSVKQVLEAHLEVGGKRVRGIRYSTIWDSDPKIRSTSPPGLLLDKKFREGFACLKDYGLSFDSWLYFSQLPELLDLAKAFPDTTIIINHMSGQLGIGSHAGRREDMFPRWKELIAELATCPNAYVKLGGMGSVRNGFGWQLREKPPDSLELAKAWAPYFNWCIEKFSPDRCMFESNFPMDRHSCSYTVLWNAFKRVAKPFSASENAALFYDTAVQIYRLT